MKNIILSTALIVFAAGAATAQTEYGNRSTDPVDREAQNKPVDLKKGEKITRGEALTGKGDKVKIEKAMKEPSKLEGKTVQIDGVVVKACTKAGCWAEIADKDGGKSVRVTFGDHAFFIPLNSAGMKVKVEGQFVTKVLTKEHVDHLINDDGATFDNRNADGTVTEVSFNATGVVLTKTN